MSPQLRGGVTGPRQTRMIDWTTFSPKAIAAVVAVVVGYLVTQEALDLPTWAEVAGQAVLVGIAAYSARPGAVVTDTRPRAGVRDERGQTNVWFLLGALTVAVVVLTVVVIT